MLWVLPTAFLVAPSIRQVAGGTRLRTKVMSATSMQPVTQTTWKNLVQSSMQNVMLPRVEVGFRQKIGSPMLNFRCQMGRVLQRGPLTSTSLLQETVHPQWCKKGFTTRCFSLVHPIPSSTMWMHWRT
uniref:Putative secreted protein n=1 Tax=Ixodes ricinus TaxID=34613 RepID=A0A6B0UQD5_IXORI